MDSFLEGKPIVSIITVNYNGWRDTCEMIDSFRQWETYPYEMIVVDNASQGEDVAQIASRYPDVKLIRSERNLGFAGGNNLGLWQASGQYIFFLNNDVVIKEPVLQRLVHHLQSGAWGGVSPCVTNLYNPGVVQYNGCNDLTSIRLHFGKSLGPVSYGARETQVLFGCAMMVRREVIERVGPMFEGYFLFYEEFDWSLRMRKAGYKLFYEPRAVIYHKESRTITRQSPLREYYMRRARVMYARRNCPGMTKYLSCLYLLFVVMPVKMVRHLRNGRPDLAVAVWRGTWSGLRPISY